MMASMAAWVASGFYVATMCRFCADYVGMNDPQLLAQLQEHSTDVGSAAWLAILARAVARGEAPADALHLRVATVAVVLLRNEFIVHGYPTVPDDVLVEIVDEVYLPLIRGRGVNVGVSSGAG